MFILSKDMTLYFRAGPLHSKDFDVCNSDLVQPPCS